VLGIIFYLIWSLLKKIIKSKFKKKIETGSNRPVSVRFCFLEEKSVQTGLARFFFGSVRFFLFQSNKIKTKLVGIFKILIGFFSRFGFFYYLFF
jgi:hypothetical protein